MFIPSIYKSTPQKLNVNVNGVVGISTVNKNYTRLSILGVNQGGNDLVYARAALNSNSQVEVFGLSSVSFTPSLDILIEEFLPLFYRQPFYFNTVDITDLSQSNTVNTGLTLGPKAFVVHLGSNFSPASIAIASYIMMSRVSLNIATGVVTATRTLGDGASNTLTTGFMVIDPK